MAMRLLAPSIAILLLTAGAPVLAQDDEDPMNDDLVDTLEDDGSTDEAFGEDEEEEEEDELSDEALGIAGPSGPKPITVALLFGYGFSLNAEETFDLNPFGIGFGARGGYNLERIYAGGRILFFLGDSEQLPGGIENSHSQFQLAIEGGYDLQVSGLLLRPSLALGISISSIESTVAGPPMPGQGPADLSSEDIFVAPGGTLLYALEGDLFVGAEAQLPIIFADPETVLGLTLMATGGMAF